MQPIRVLVAGHDWGGLNVLAPLLRAWTAHPRIVPHFLAAPVVRRDFSHRVQDLVFAPASEELTEFLCHRPAELSEFLDRVLERGRYDAVVCGTSAHALLERRLFKAARARSIASVAMCDMWWAYTERFHDGTAWMLPDVLWVIDEPMRASASAVQWPEPLPIEVQAVVRAARKGMRVRCGSYQSRPRRSIPRPISTSSSWRKRCSPGCAR
jgi:hypothetical protein